ncbi:MAG: amino acid ABC transporter permease [Bifidobacteriaceae bacterium]|nr:amino acid ABC transporter permease [Bifidobacteriaceae bacterium]
MSPRKKAKISQAAQYGVLAIVIVLALKAMDWDKLRTQMFNVNVIASMLDALPRAFANTLLYTICAFAVGLSLGMVLALMKMSSVGPYRWLATAYAEFFRGIPALLVVLSIGFLIPILFGIKLPNMTVKIGIALGLVSAAYVSETLRAGLQAVPRGQVEAARSLGLSQSQAMRSVVVPQAFRIVLPPLTNELILITKDTSFVYLLGLATSEYELTKLGTNALNQASGGLTGVVVVGLVYLIITLPLGHLARRMEKKNARQR